MIIYKYRLNEEIPKNLEFKNRNINGYLLKIDTWYISKKKIEKFKTFINQKIIIEEESPDNKKIENPKIKSIIKEEKKIKSIKKEPEPIINKMIEDIEYDLPKKEEKKIKKQYSKRTYKTKEKNNAI